MKKTFLVFVLTAALLLPSLSFGQAEAAKPKSPARRAAEGVTAAQLKDYLYFIASDEMEGRDTPSRGLNTTAKFIAMQLSRWGVKPAGDDGTYFQKIALRGIAPDPARSSAELGGQRFILGSDFIRLSGAAATAVSAPLVYGGSGWMIKSKNIDTLQGVDVKGKFVVLYSTGAPSAISLASLPAGITPQDLTGRRNIDWADPIVNARLKGAGRRARDSFRFCANALGEPARFLRASKLLDGKDPARRRRWRRTGSCLAGDLDLARNGRRYFCRGSE